MRAAEKLSTTLPEHIDIDRVNTTKRTQTIRALSVDFRESVKSKGSSSYSLEKTIQELSVKDINDIFFDDAVPNAPGKVYYALIEEFLSGPEFYKKEIKVIVDGYLSIVSDLQKRVQELIINGKTDEGDPNFRTSTATYLDARLTSICERTKLIISVYANVDQIQAQLGDIITSVQDLSDKITDIDTSSDQIMPNIISLMGIFSSIIVVILSLITTSSTWLANSNETSVLIAFVVPAGIITLAICALTALVRSLVDSKPRNNNTGNETFKLSWNSLRFSLLQFSRRWGLWIVIVSITCLFVHYTITFCQDEEASQVHYLAQYSPVSENTGETDNEETKPISDVLHNEFYIVQEVLLPTGEVFLNKIPCSENNIHEDGYVYYCLLHQRFE